MILSELYQQFKDQAGKEVAEYATGMARMDSMGPHTLAYLASVGHPYAKRAPQTGAFPPEYINRQTGEFERGWHVQAPRTEADGYAVVNDSEVADFLRKGTKYMVPRPVGDLATKQGQQYVDSGRLKALSVLSVRL